MGFVPIYWIDIENSRLRSVISETKRAKGKQILVPAMPTKPSVRRMKEMEVDKEKMLHIQDNNADGRRMIPLEKFGWVFLNEIGFMSAATMTALMIIEVMSIEDRTLYEISAAMTIPHGSLVFWIHYKCRGLPNRLVGRYGRAVLDIFSLCAAVMLHVFFPYDGSYLKKRALVILVGLTLQLHGWGQSFHLTWDIGIDDVVVQSLMEVGTYLSGGMTWVFLVLLFCCIIWYRFYSYSIPSTPENIKKEGQCPIGHQNKS